jgi:hypothetical protein
MKLKLIHESSKTGALSGTEEKQFNQDIRAIHRRYDSINSGGCGAFAKLLYYTIKKWFGITPEIILLNFATADKEQPIKDINSYPTFREFNDKSGCYAVHVMLKMPGDDKHLIDSEGIHTRKWVNSQIPVKNFLEGMNIQTLTKWVEDKHGWNPWFSRYQIGNIGIDLENVMNDIKNKNLAESSMKFKDLLNEITYKEYKNDTSISSKQKLNIAIKECNRALFEIERYLKQNKKLREEEGLALGDYWKSTGRKLVKMSERLRFLQKEIKKFGLKDIVKEMEIDEIAAADTPLTLDIFKTTISKYFKDTINPSFLSDAQYQKLFKFIMKKDPSLTRQSILPILKQVGNGKYEPGTIKNEIESYFGV